MTTKKTFIIAALILTVLAGAVSIQKVMASSNIPVSPAATVQKIDKTETDKETADGKDTETNDDKNNVDVPEANDKPDVPGQPDSEAGN